MTENQYLQTAVPTTEQHEGTATATRPENSNIPTTSNQCKHKVMPEIRLLVL